jgi:hypothetical protein
MVLAAITNTSALAIPAASRSVNQAAGVVGRGRQ